jgi:CheY-like chemotaxis protein
MSTKQSRQMILVVDDEQAVCETVAMILRSRGYLVHTANNGSDALRRLKNMRLDLVISDLNMPGMSGFDLISAIRSRFPSMPVVAMSAAYTAECLPTNLDAFYAKGQGDPQQLLSMVEELLSREHNPGVKGGKRHLRRARPAA